ILEHSKLLTERHQRVVLYGYFDRTCTRRNASTCPSCFFLCTETRTRMPPCGLVCVSQVAGPWPCTLPRPWDPRESRSAPLPRLAALTSRERQQRRRGQGFATRQAGAQPRRCPAPPSAR